MLGMTEVSCHFSSIIPSLIKHPPSIWDITYTQIGFNRSSQVPWFKDSIITIKSSERPWWHWAIHWSFKVKLAHLHKGFPWCFGPHLTLYRQNLSSFLPMLWTLMLSHFAASPDHSLWAVLSQDSYLLSVWVSMSCSVCLPFYSESLFVACSCLPGT